MIKDEVFKLSNGINIPKVGFGTWQASPDDAYNSTLIALKNGYRHIDTAYAYHNEESIGKAIKDSNIKREELFITTKCPAEIKTYEGVKKHFYASLKALNLDYIDLYLIHAPWPWSNVGQNCDKENVEVWKAFIDLYKEGLIKSIGVSNFSIHDIENIVSSTSFVPHVNQIRYFIGNRQQELTSYCQKHNILVEAYSPLATGKIVEDDKLLNIAKKYNVSTAQLCIRFCLENNTLPLPKSIHEERIKANIDLDFNISKEDMEILNSLVNDELKRPLRS